MGRTRTSRLTSWLSTTRVELGRGGDVTAEEGNETVKKI